MKNDKEAKEAWKDFFEKLEELDAEGCTGCAFADRYKWEMPCSNCKRNCEDYWRKKNDNN